MVQFSIRFHWMCFEPERACCDGRINPGLQPPHAFIAAKVDLAVEATTQGNSKLVANLAAKRPALAKAQMMGIARLATTNQARIRGDVMDVAAVPNQTRGSGNAKTVLSIPCDRSRPELGLPPRPSCRWR
jgi:hypothetical protein